MASPQRRDVSKSRFGHNATIHQGDVHHHPPRQPARAAPRAIPYPRNEDVVQRPGLIDKINQLLPPTATEYCSAALHGLGGSGRVVAKRRIAGARLTSAAKPRLRSIMHTDDVATGAALFSGCMRTVMLLS